MTPCSIVWLIKLSAAEIAMLEATRAPTPNPVQASPPLNPPATALTNIVYPLPPFAASEIAPIAAPTIAPATMC